MERRPGPGNRRAALVVLPLALLLATLAAYHPAWHGTLLWDDDAHVTRPELQGADGLRRIWIEPGATQQYYPLVHSAFWLQHRLWGDDTFGYHLLNIVLHACSAFLLAVILRRLRVPWAWLAGLIFALHPVHVESVAWITELKNTLSAVFYLGAALAWLIFDTRRQARFYALAVGLFALALLSKSVTATLPAALLIVLWWQRGTLSWRRDVLPLVPLFALGAGAGLFTAWVERTMIGAHGASFAFTPIERGLIAGRAIWFYLAKLAWPAHLTFIYPRWQVSQQAWWQYLFPAAAIALVTAAWLARKRSRAPLAALLFFGVTLFPALGFFNVFPFRYSLVADHFQYLASMSIIALFCATLAGLVRAWRIPRTGAAIGALVIAGTLGLLTFRQSGDYADAATLYRATLARDPRCWMAHNNLGFLQLTGAPEEAERHFRAALAVKADYPEAHNNLGYVLQLQGRLEEAAREYQEALRLEPAYAEARNNLGTAFERMGRPVEAAAQYELAIKVRPAFVQAHTNLGNVLVLLGRPAEALAEHEKALRLDPADAEARNNLGASLDRIGRLPEAAAQFEAAVRIRPDFADARANLGSALARLGRSSEAMTQLEEAVRLAPDNLDARRNLAALLERAGRMEDAAAQYKEAARLDPRSVAAHTTLGNTLYALGRLEEAGDQYRQAIALMPDSADAHNNLGAVLERLGRIDEAIAEYRQTVRLRPDAAAARTNLNRAIALKTSHAARPR